MKKLLSLFLLLAVSLLHTQAQNDYDLNGTVVIQNSKHKTGKIEFVQDASIDATQAIPTKSDSKGAFNLYFADVPYGDVCHIFAEKHGLEVVNKSDLEHAVVVNRKVPLKIVMCEQGELYDNQIAY